jgi:MFS family permease
MTKSLEKKLQSNIWKLNLYIALYSITFFTPVMVLYFQENGLSISQIMILQSIHALVFVILEVPSGYLADLYGRKKALLLTGVFSTAAMTIFAIGTNFYHFLIAGILWGLAGVFVSGADAALMYDTLIDLKKEASYKKIWGQNSFYYYIGISVSSIIGGVIATIDYQYTYYAVIPTMALLIPLSLSFQEPKKHKEVFKKNYLRNLLKTIKKSILENKKLRWLFIYAAVLTTFINIAFFLYQPYLQLTGLDIVYFGAVFASFNIIIAFSSKYAHAIEEKVGKKYSLISLFILIGTSFLLMSHFIYLFSFCFALFIQFAKGFSQVVISDYVHQLTTSNIRATILSLKSLIERLFFTILSPLIGWVVDIYSLQQALTVSGTIILISGGISILGLWKSKTLQTS